MERHDFEKRMDTEKEIDKLITKSFDKNVDPISYTNISFNETETIIIYSSPIGIKIVSLKSNEVLFDKK